MVVEVVDTNVVVVEDLEMDTMDWVKVSVVVVRMVTATVDVEVDVDELAPARA